MPRPLNPFPSEEKTNFQRIVSFKLREKEKNWISGKLSLSESHFRSIMNGTKTPSLDIIFEVGKMLKIAPKALIGTDKFSLRKQSVAKSRVPELAKEHGIDVNILVTIYKIPPTTSRRILRGESLDYKNLQNLYMKVFRSRGVESILDLISFE